MGAMLKSPMAENCTIPLEDIGSAAMGLTVMLCIWRVELIIMELPPQEAINLMAIVSHWARELMHQGAPLVHRLPGRAGWELRLVVQGGLRILDKIEALGFDTFSQRPTIGKLDAPVLLWKAMRMRRQLRPMKAAPPR